MSEEGTINLISKEGDVFEVPRSAGLMSVIVKETLCEEDDDDDCDDDDDEEEEEEDEIEDEDNSIKKTNKNNNKKKATKVIDIPLPNVSATILSKVIEYCKHYQEVEEMTPIVTPLRSKKLEDLVQRWYVEYIKVDRTILFDLVAAANFMDIKPLLDLSCLAVSILIKGKSATELREMFNIPNELSADELAQINRESSWIDNNNNNNNNPTVAPTQSVPTPTVPSAATSTSAVDGGNNASTTITMIPETPTTHSSSGATMTTPASADSG